MARHRRKRRHRKNGNGAKLLFTSKVRRNAMLIGIAISPFIFATQMGSQYAGWVTAKFNELKGRV